MEYRITTTLDGAEVLPPDVQERLEEIQSEAQNAAFTFIWERLKGLGYEASGDVDPGEAAELDEVFGLFVRWVALNVPSICASQADGAPEDDEVEVDFGPEGHPSSRGASSSGASPDPQELVAFRSTDQGENPFAALWPFPAGTRVRLTFPVDRFPHFRVDKGATGTVTAAAGDDRIFAVTLDVPVDGAEDWENEIQWMLDAGDEPGEVLEEIRDEIDRDEFDALLWRTAPETWAIRARWSGEVLVDACESEEAAWAALPAALALAAWKEEEQAHEERQVCSECDADLSVASPGDPHDPHCPHYGASGPDERTLNVAVAVIVPYDAPATPADVADEVRAALEVGADPEQTPALGIGRIDVQAVGTFDPSRGGASGTADRYMTPAQLRQVAALVAALADDDGDGSYVGIDIQGDWYDPDNFRFAGNDDFPRGTIRVSTGWSDGNNDGPDDRTFLTYIAPDGTVVANYEAH